MNIGYQLAEFQHIDEHVKLSNQHKHFVYGQLHLIHVLMDIDVILAKGWLFACKGVIKYAQCSVLLTTALGERIEYEGIQPAPEEDENDLLEGVSCEDKKNGL